MTTREQMIADCERKHGFKPTLWCCARPDGHRGNCKMVPVTCLSDFDRAKCSGQELVDYEVEDTPELGAYLEGVRDYMNVIINAKHNRDDSSKSLKWPIFVPADSRPE